MNTTHTYEQAKKLAARPYPFRLYRDHESDEEIMYLAENPDLDGCMAQGASQVEAIQNLTDARIDYIDFLLEHGLPVPEPSGLLPGFTQSPNQGFFKINDIQSEKTTDNDATTNSEVGNQNLQPDSRELIYEAQIKIA
jgi:predicted RNase H-like HicB family nuclease